MLRRATNRPPISSTDFDFMGKALLDSEFRFPSASCILCSMKYRLVNLRQLFLRATLISLALFLLAVTPVNTFAQDDSPWKGGSPPQSQPRESPPIDEQNIVERAISIVCTERAR